MTNVANAHTFSLGSVNLILPAIFLTDYHLLQLAGDVVVCAPIHVPVCVHAVGAIYCARDLLILGRLAVILIMVRAVACGVAMFATDLVARGVRTRA